MHYAGESLSKNTKSETLEIKTKYILTNKSEAQIKSTSEVISDPDLDMLSIWAWIRDPDLHSESGSRCLKTGIKSLNLLQVIVVVNPLTTRTVL
jgi:hypothetical protein